MLSALARNAIAAETIAISIGQISAPELRVDDVLLRWDAAGKRHSASLSIRQLSRRESKWDRVRVSCPALEATRSALGCGRGLIEVNTQRWPLRFLLAEHRMQAEVIPAAQEHWRLGLERAGPGRQWAAQLKLVNAQLTRLNPLLPAGQPRFKSGLASVAGKLSFSASGAAIFNAQADISTLSFADAEGLRAGENLALAIKLQAQSSAQHAWTWDGDVRYLSGEVFWAPIYFASGGHRVRARGAWRDQRLRIDDAEVALAQVGTLKLGASLNVNPARLDRARVSATDIDLGKLYPLLVKPFVEQPEGTQYEVQGRADVALDYAAAGVRAFDLKLRAGALADSNGRFALRGISAHVPWVNDRATQGVIRVSDGEFWRMPLRNAQARAELNGYQFKVPRLAFEILDGIFALSDFSAERGASGWRWEFTAGLTPVSLPKLTQALQLPNMLGTFAAVVPRVRYQDKSVSVDGAVTFDVFGGNMVLRSLLLRDPIGDAPRLDGDIVMRNLDLDLLTRTFSFGRMTGRIDVDVTGMELVNWKPVRFDARVASSPGRYPRRISQQAVQNISSLGGAGASAALQRSFLRIFETFGYARAGLSCQLRGSVCTMGGVADTAQGYIIVQGGGIPAITVMGYNRNVGWEELLRRVKRVTQQGTQAIIK